MLSLPIPAFFNHIIAKEVMRYKEQIKQDELTTKVRIIRYVRKEHLPITQVATAFSCHRNTIGNIIATFDEKISPEDQRLLLRPGTSLTQEELCIRYARLLNTSTKPHSNKRSADTNAEEKIVHLFTEEKIRVGVKRMRTFLKRRYGIMKESGRETKIISVKHPETKLTIGQLKGIYKRHQFRIQKVRSSNGERRALYDYQALSCFERLHYDVKHILDKHALPQEIYQILSGKNIPKYEWNIIDAKSRFRFIAYSYDICAEFGLHFLLFVIQYIRSSVRNLEQDMRIGFDNGTEFCSGSSRKEIDWNVLVNCMNAGVYSYEPGFDIRKNLIERSHLSDDEELYIPRGIFMNTKQGFIKEVTDYAFYWNTERPHSGINMNDQTPYEVVKQSGLLGTEKLMVFPTLILDDVINELKMCTKSVVIDAYAREHPDIMRKMATCLKTRRDIESKFFLPTDAQNVLTYYQSYPIEDDTIRLFASNRKMILSG